MTSKRFRRYLSIALSAAMTASCVTAGMTVSALDSQPPTGNQAIGKAQPHFPGYRVKDLQNWSKNTDPSADMMRARIPLQDRNEAFQATQADPTLTDDAKVMLMQGDYGNSFFDSMIYNNDFSEHCFNFWQYTDLWSPWHGAATAYSPKSLKELGFNVECGMINIPNPAYTNAAHKNGVKSIACIYFDQAYRPGQSINEMLDRDEDGNFLVVDKLVEMAEYYGYDGYFLNEEDFPSEEAGGNAALQELMSQLTARGMYTQYYSANKYNVTSNDWLKNANGETVCNSIFPNYGCWNWGIDSSMEWCKNNGYNIYDVGYFGLECNQGGLNSSPGSNAFLPGSKNLKASIALFTPSDNYQRGLTFSTNDYRPAFQQARYQWMVTERERIFFSGAKEDPTDTNFSGSVDWSVVGAGNVYGHGVAEYISERSVIDGSTFYTNFNTGHGMQYFVDGAVSQDDEWAHIGIQDLLPTWQWWIDTEGTKLGVDFDYGEKYVRASRSGTDLGTPYTKVGGYNGGSSLVVYGDIDAENFLRLYKTDLQVNENSKFSITYNKTSATDSSDMAIGVIFKNAPDSVVTFNVPSAGQHTDGWVTKEISIPEDYADEQIAAIGLVFRNNETSVQDFQMNIGELKLLDGNDYTPETPTNLSIRAAYDTKEMILTWDLADYDTVQKYNVYANLSDGRKVYLGGVYDEIYYIKNSMADDIVTMEVTAVGKDGSESEPATIEYAYNQNVANIQVNEVKDSNGLTMQAAGAGYLDISWTNPDVDYKELKLDLALVNVEEDKTYSMTVANGVESARMYIPRGHGETYDLYITTVYEDGSESEPISYRGRLKDVWSQPIDERDVKINGNNISFVNPASVDWYKIHAYANGKEFYLGTRGSSRINNGVSIPAGASSVKIVLEDFSGNLSQPLTVSVGSKTGSIDGTTVPDAVLRQAIIDQIGDNIADVSAFTGTLDLSGLDIHDLTGLQLVSCAAEINLSGTPIESLSKGTFGGSVQKVVLKNCTALTMIYPDTFAGTSVKEVDISGCTALRIVSFNDSELEKISCDDLAALTNVAYVDMSGSRFDLTEGTPEKAFVDAMIQMTEDKEDVQVISPNITNLTEGVQVIESNKVTNPGNLFSENSMMSVSSVPAYVTFKLSAPQTIEAYRLISIYGSSYMAQNFAMYYSEDGENFTLMGEAVMGNRTTPYQQQLSNPVTAQYFKLEITKGGPYGIAYIHGLQMLGKNTISYPAGVKIENQRPRIIPGEMDTTIVAQKHSGQSFDPNEMLANAKQLAQENKASVRGTSIEQLTGADFIDPNYELVVENQKEREVHLIQVTDRDGNVSYNSVINGADDNVYTVEYMTYDSANLEGDALYTFTVKVRGITSILEKVIAEAEQLKGDGGLENTMEAVVTEYNAALEAAKAIVVKDDASQKEINDATLRLLAAMAKVDWKQGDKTLLEIAVELATNIETNLDLYVEAGKPEFIDALTEGRALLNSGNAWQDDIDAATDRLVKAMTALRMVPNKDILTDMIANAKGIDLSAYTEKSANAMCTALAAAESVAADDNADQDAVDAAADTLKAAMNGLVFVSGDANNNNTPVDGTTAANGNTTTNVGGGTEPSKTGDNSATGLALLVLVSVAGVVAMRKRKNR